MAFVNHTETNPYTRNTRNDFHMEKTDTYIHAYTCQMLYLCQLPYTHKNSKDLELFTYIQLRIGISSG